MSVLASLVAAAQDVNVKILDDGRGGLSVRDLVIPIGALVAGIGGVLIGGVIQHRIEKKRGERDDQLDERRANRERALEDERQRRADNADKRRAIGSARVAAFYFSQVIAHANAASDLRSDRLMDVGMEKPPGAGDEHLLACWLSGEGWKKYTIAKRRLALYASTDYGGTGDYWLEFVSGVTEDAASARDILKSEIDRLAREIGGNEVGLASP